MSNLSLNATVETERALAATSFNGSQQNIGTALTNNPVIIVFDNQTDVSVPLYINNVKYKTFASGQSFVLDCRANHGIAANFTFSIGTQFSTNASVGTTGSFLISILNAGYP